MQVCVFQIIGINFQTNTEISCLGQIYDPLLNTGVVTRTWKKTHHQFNQTNSFWLRLKTSLTVLRLLQTRFLLFMNYTILCHYCIVLQWEAMLISCCPGRLCEWRFLCTKKTAITYFIILNKTKKKVNFIRVSIN